MDGPKQPKNLVLTLPVLVPQDSHYVPSPEVGKSFLFNCANSKLLSCFVATVLILFTATIVILHVCVLTVNDVFGP